MRLVRVASGKLGTMGVLCDGDIPVCVTCEDPWNDNQRAISCIPAGKYKVVKFSGTRFKDVWEVLDVPNRTAILFHAGNTIEDTHGCILVGRGFAKFGNMPGVTDSQATLSVLRKTLPHSFDLEVVDL